MPKKSAYYTHLKKTSPPIAFLECSPLEVLSDRL